MIDRPVTPKEYARITVNGSKIRNKPSNNNSTSLIVVTKQITVALFLDICDISLQVFTL